MGLSNGVDLVAYFDFWKAGALADPSPLPTLVTGSLYPSGATGPTPALTHVGTGVFSATVFTAAENILAGTYSAWVYVDDASLDSKYSPKQWVEVGISVEAGDPLDNEVPNSYAAGTAGYALGLLTAPGLSLTVVGPMVTGRPIRIYRGFDYRTAEAQQIYWDLVGWPTLVGATAKFLGCGSSLDLAINTTTNRLTLELTKAQSTALALGFDTYGIYVTFANLHETLVGVGDIQVRPKPD